MRSLLIFLTYFGIVFLVGVSFLFLQNQIFNATNQMNNSNIHYVDGLVSNSKEKNVEVGEFKKLNYEQVDMDFKKTVKNLQTGVYYIENILVIIPPVGFQYEIEDVFPTKRELKVIVSKTNVENKEVVPLFGEIKKTEGFIVGVYDEKGYFLH